MAEGSLLQFPLSRTCLWDSSGTGVAAELRVSGTHWLRLRFKHATLSLAMRQARHSPRTYSSCFFIAVSWTTDDGGLVLEVDRFDPGRPVEREGEGEGGMVPTALIPGDIAIPSQVVLSSRAKEAAFLPFNLASLQAALLSLSSSMASLPPLHLPPPPLLSLRLLLACSPDGATSLHCGCVMPWEGLSAQPVAPIPIVPTALARNLTGPLPLSALHGSPKHGYLTMEKTRKLVLLLHSDPKAPSLPLVGIWVSGVCGVQHPTVCVLCEHYLHARHLEKVWGGRREGEGEGEGFLVLLYLQGASRPAFWQCGRRAASACGFDLHAGEARVQCAGEEGGGGGGVVEVELMPVTEATALHTLLHTALTTSVRGGGVVSEGVMSVGVKRERDMLEPLPPPLPTITQPPQLTSDADLSCLSFVEDGAAETFQLKSTSGPNDSDNLLLREQLQALQQQVNALMLTQPSPPLHTQSQSPPLHPPQSQSPPLHTPQSPYLCTSDAATNTGASLYEPRSRPHPQPHSRPHPQEVDCSTASSYLPEEFSVCTRDTSPLTCHSSHIHQLDFPSYEQSSCGGTVSECSSVVAGESASLVADRQFYNNILQQVQALLSHNASSSEPSTPPNSHHSSGHAHSQPETGHAHSQPETGHAHSSHEHSTCSLSECSTGHAHFPTTPAHLPLSMLHCTDALLTSTIAVPRIQCSVSLDRSSMMDDTTHLADLISHKYLPQDGTGLTGAPCPAGHPPSTSDVSLATERYLQRHNLWKKEEDRPQPLPLLDTKRLKMLPKLI